MTMKNIVSASIFILILGSAPTATGADDKYNITAQERAWCEGDAIRLCSNAGQDEDTLVICMKISRQSLTPGCRVVFDAGLRRRGLR
jgi:hypothetical protein